LSALAVHLKATYSQLKMYIWFVLMIIVLGRIVELFVTSYLDNSGISRLSESNMLILLLPLMAIALPLSYYNRIVHLGASREQYFKGLHAVFAVWAVAIALFNSLWITLQIHVFHNYDSAVDLVDAFHWNDFGFAGSFLYQTAFYLMAMALLSMLASGYLNPVGWLLSAMIIAAIPIGTAIPSLRIHVVSFFKKLLFNDSLLLGVGFNLLLYLLFAAVGWVFTRMRVH
jgi:heme/copper-type cytochrome/quinol oxidase subunit 4